MSDELKTETQEVSSEQDAFVKNMRTMNLVISQMKEIPELPSEAPKDTNPLLKVEFPEVGGILTYMEGHEHPYRGFPYFEFVEKIDLMKKIVRATLSGAYHQLKSRPKIMLATLVPAMWVVRPLTRIGVYVFFRMIERFRIKTERYSQPIRELHRVFSLEPEGEAYADKEFRTQLRDLLCMTAEFDNAYRFRLQDTLVELDKQALQTNDLVEMDRIFKLLYKREKTQEIRDTWRLMMFFVRYYLRFDKVLRSMIVNSLKNLDLSEIELKPEDKHYCRPRKDYNFQFMQEENTESNNNNDELLLLKRQDTGVEVSEVGRNYHAGSVDAS